MSGNAASPTASCPSCVTSQLISMRVERSLRRPGADGDGAHTNPIWVKQREAFDCLIAASRAIRPTGCGSVLGLRGDGGGLLPPLEPDPPTLPPNSNLGTWPFTHPPGLSVKVAPPG